MLRLNNNFNKLEMQKKNNFQIEQHFLTIKEEAFDTKMFDALYV